MSLTALWNVDNKEKKSKEIKLKKSKPVHKPFRIIIIFSCEINENIIIQNTKVSYAMFFFFQFYSFLYITRVQNENILVCLSITKATIFSIEMKSSCNVRIVVSTNVYFNGITVTQKKIGKYCLLGVEKQEFYLYKAIRIKYMQMQTTIE